MASAAASSSLGVSFSASDFSFSSGHKTVKETRGFGCANLVFGNNKKAFGVGTVCLRTKRCIYLKTTASLHTASWSDDGQLVASSVDASLATESASVDGPETLSSESKIQADPTIFGAIAADLAPAVAGFFSDNDEYNLESPTPGFCSISEAIEDIRQGKLVIVVDDEDRENEGDLIMAASLVTPDAMAFMVRHSTGIVCVSMKEDDLERLRLPLMVNHKENDEKLCTAFTVTVDAKVGTTTGVSAKDRATTILTLASPNSKPEDFNRPGHIFPLKYREGGVLKRAGHTEASVDLAMLAGLPHSAVLCEIVDDDGSMARLPNLREFAQRENLKIISIADLIRN